MYVWYVLVGTMPHTAATQDETTSMRASGIFAPVLDFGFDLSRFILPKKNQNLPLPQGLFTITNSTEKKKKARLLVVDAD